MSSSPPYFAVARPAPPAAIRFPALEEYLRHGGRDRLVREALKHLKGTSVFCRDEAEECVSLAMVKALKYRDSYDPRYPIEVWLKRILARVCADQKQRVARANLVEIDSLTESAQETACGASPSVEDLVFSEESDDFDLSAVVESLSALTCAERVALEMAAGRESREATAAVLGCSVPEAVLTVRQAKERLRYLVIQARTRRSQEQEEPCPLASR